MNALEGAVPPLESERHSLERVIVGTAMMSPHQFPALRETVGSFTAFTHEPARIIGMELEKRIPKGLPVDHTALSVALGPQNLRRIGGPAILSVFAGEAVPDALWHADQLRRLALRHEAKQQLFQAINQLDTDDDVAKAIEAAVARIGKVQQQATAVGLAAQQTRRLVLTPVSAIKIRPVHWLWDTTPPGAAPTSHGRIPMYSLALAAGGPGLGKSQCACWIAAQVTRGTLPGELYGRPRAVIYAASEDSWAHTIAPRLTAAGADLDLVFRVDVQDDGESHARLTLPIDISLLGRAAEEYGVALVVADPLLSLIDKGINDYRAAEVRAALEPLVEAADRHGFTILGLAHFTKAGGSDPVDRIAGSGAFGQLIRSLIAFARRDDENGDPEFVMSLEKNNLGRIGLPSYTYAIQPVTVDTSDGPSYVSRFVLGPESTTSVREVMREESALGAIGREELTEAAAWLRSRLADLGGTDSAREIKKAAKVEGYSASAIDRAKKKLGLIAEQVGFGAAKTSMWSLPDALPLPQQPSNSEEPSHAH